MRIPVQQNSHKGSSNSQVKRYIREIDERRFEEWEKKVMFHSSSKEKIWLEFVMKEGKKTIMCYATIKIWMLN